MGERIAHSYQNYLLHDKKSTLSPTLVSDDTLDHGPVGEILHPLGIFEDINFQKLYHISITKGLSDQKSMVEYAKEANSKW